MDRWLQRATGAIALAYIVLFIVLALWRIAYPFELEFLEGTSAIMVERILYGQAIYVRPTLAFIPSNYTPLYYYLSAAIAAVIGNGLLALRIVSLVSSIATLACIYLFAWRETRRHVAGLIGAGIYAASFARLGPWYDIARNDSLFLAFFLWAAYIIRFHPGTRWTVAAAFLLTVSFFTKQTAATLAPALVIYCAFTNRRQCLTLLLTGGSVSAIALLALHTSTDGWFTYYVYRIAGLHPFDRTRFVRFWPFDMSEFAFAAAASLAMLWLAGKRREHTLLYYYALLLVTALLSSWSIRSHEGAYLNVLMPAVAALSVTAAIGFGMQVPRIALSRLLQFSALIQMLALIYNPVRLVPTSADKHAGEAVVRQLSEMPGEKWLPSRGYLARLAGENAYANAITIWDVLADPRQRTQRGLQGEILNALQQKRFSCIIFDADPNGNPVSKPSFIDQFYASGEKVAYPSRDVFRPITGMRSRPEVIYLP